MNRSWVFGGGHFPRLLLLLFPCLFLLSSVSGQSSSEIYRHQGVAPRVTDCSAVSIPSSECNALVDLYNTTVGSGWKNDNHLWLIDNLPCDWYGVTCLPDKSHVQKLDLRGNGLAGNLPSSLGNLTEVQELYFQDNPNLGGGLPASITALTKLTVLLAQNNKISSNIPSGLGNLPLVRLNLSANRLTGGIPIQLGNIASLQILNLSGNLLSGSIPTSLGNLASLERLYLDGNQLSGSIPPQLGNLSTLIELDLSDNKLTGSIPASLNSLTNLVKFRVGMNLLTGTIPDLHSLTKLQWFYLNYNQLTGSLPAWLGDFTALKYFYLNNNLFTGSLPPELGTLSAVLDFNLSYNSFSGSIPESYSGLTSVQNFVVGSNKLSGGFPMSMVALPINVVRIDYNMIAETDPTIVAYLNLKNPGWHLIQTISPVDVTATTDADGLIVNWTPILYTGDGGYYVVRCNNGSTDVTINTENKTASQVIFSGLPAGDYTCSVKTFTPRHSYNFNDLLSGENDDSIVNPPAGDTPPNDLFLNPILFETYPRQNYSFNIGSATTDTDPIPPIGDENCPVVLPPAAAGIHYQINGDAPDFGNVGGQGLVVRAGGPGWYRRAPAADTAIVVYELNPDDSLGSIVACADDNAPGEVSVSNARFNLDTTKRYHVVVWNEGAAPEGAIIQIGLASFDLVSPENDTIFTQPDRPTSFTWKAYSDAEVYYFDLARTSDPQLPELQLNELTSNDSTDDGLECDLVTCTLTVLPGSTLDNFLNNSGITGNYIWSVSAKITDPNNPDMTLVRDSNQIFRLIIGAPPATSTPTETDTPDGTITPTETATATATATGTVTPTATVGTGSEILVNGGMETDDDQDTVPDGWTLKNSSADKRKCNQEGYPPVSHSGECAFMFKARPGEKASLEQKQDGSMVPIGSKLTLGVTAKGKKISTGIKVQLTIQYVTLDPVKLNLPIPSGNLPDYLQLTVNHITSADISQFKLKLKYRSLAGKLYVDDFSLWVEPGSGVMPLPSSLTGRSTP